MHGHGFAMLFLAEAYGMDRDSVRQTKIRKVLEKAIKLTGQSQSAAGGWLYQPNSGGDEGSVTVTQIQGLRACRDAGIKVPKTIIDKACKYIADSKNPDGGISYRVGQPGSHPPITAAAVATTSPPIRSWRPTRDASPGRPSSTPRSAHGLDRATPTRSSKPFGSGGCR